MAWSLRKQLGLFRRQKWEDLGGAEGLLGHGGGCWAAFLWLNQKKQEAELFFSSVLSLWAGQGWGQHRLSCALLTTENAEQCGYLKLPCSTVATNMWFPKSWFLCSWWRSSADFRASLVPFFGCVRSCSSWWLSIVEKSWSSQVLNNISHFLPVGKMG